MRSPCHCSLPPARGAASRCGATAASRGLLQGCRQGSVSNREPGEGLPRSGPYCLPQDGTTAASHGKLRGPRQGSVSNHVPGRSPQTRKGPPWGGATAASRGQLKGHRQGSVSDHGPGVAPLRLVSLRLQCRKHTQPLSGQGMSPSRRGCQLPPCGLLLDDPLCLHLPGVRSFHHIPNPQDLVYESLQDRPCHEIAQQGIGDSVLRPSRPCRG